MSPALRKELDSLSPEERAEVPASLVDDLSLARASHARVPFEVSDCGGDPLGNCRGPRPIRFCPDAYPIVCSGCCDYHKCSNTEVL